MYDPNREFLLVPDDRTVDVEESEHYKSVYAHFGAAIYFAQCLEHGLVNARVYVDLIPNHPKPVRTLDDWTRSFDGFMGKQFENTLGTLISQLRKLAPVPDELSKRLAEALRARNWLAHDYFRERALEWITRDGRDRMISELERCRKQFADADDMLETFVRPHREKFGFTDEKLQQAYESMMADARAVQK